MTMQETMTTQEAVTILETCAHDYTQRVHAFQKLRAAAILALQLEQSIEETQRRLRMQQEALAQTVSALEALAVKFDEEKRDMALKRQALGREMEEEQRQHDRMRARFQEELALVETQQNRARATMEQEFMAWKARVTQERQHIVQEHAAGMEELEAKRAAAQEQLDIVRAELVGTRQRLLELTGNLGAV